MLSVFWNLKLNRLAVIAAYLVAATALATSAEEDSYLGPSALCVSKDETSLFVACQDAKILLCVTLADGKVSRKIELTGQPSGIALAPDGKRLYVTCSAAKSDVAEIDLETWKIIRHLPAGHTAMSPVVSRDGTVLFVCNRFQNNVSRIDLASGKELDRLPVPREPVAAALTPDGKTLVVANHLPHEQTDVYPLSAAVSFIDLASLKIDSVKLPDGSHSLRGLCISPDGAHVYLTHLLSNFNLVPSQVDMGWMSSNCVTILDTAKKERLKTIGLDESYIGAGNPWDAATTADGQWVCVSHAGSHELSVLHAESMRGTLVHIATASLVESIPYLPFGEPKAWRVRLPDKGPRALVVVGQKAYLANYFSDTLSVVDLKAGAEGKPETIALGDPPKMSLRRRGELLFNDATICYQRWQSCASCHPDARSDVLNWDLVNDGIGNPKNTKSLLLSFQTPPAMATGVRDSAATAVRTGMANILFAVRPAEELLAIDEYLRTLQPVESPHLVEGKLSEAAQRGKAIFNSDRVACAVCHPAPLYTDMKMHNVGSRAVRDQHDMFDTPTLVEIWRTAPYLHDGHYASMQDLLLVGKHGMPRGSRALKDEEAQDLIEFILSL